MRQQLRKSEERCYQFTISSNRVNSCFGQLIVRLALINAKIAITLAFVFGTLYYAFAIVTKRELKVNGKKVVEASRQQIKALQEGLGAIRDVPLDNSQNYYVEIYKKLIYQCDNYKQKTLFWQPFLVLQ